MIYVHVPFCRSFCTYCGFYSELCTDRYGFGKAFAQAACKEIADRKAEIGDTLGCNTIYVGGGTPSVLPPSVLSDIVAAARESIGPNPLQEFTIEVNPDDVTAEYASFLKSLGVTRVSMGVQSFDDRVLKWMNRRHDAAQSVRAYRLLEEAGFDNISIDLIFGLPGMSLYGWSVTLEKALSISSHSSVPAHISAYQLSIEPDSALEGMIASGKLEEASEESCSAQYDFLCSTLREAGYEHYEISNFAQPGRQAVHNSAYWSHAPYVGIGPGAHSLSFAGGCWKRSWNKPDVDAYLKERQTDGECLSDCELGEETIMLSLRRSEGISAERLRQLAGDEVVDELLSRGHLEYSHQNANFRIPEKHCFISDSIIKKLF